MGDLDSISIAYEGVPTPSGFTSFATSTHNGTPAMWTLSEPYGAKDWWPCKQDLVDKIDSIDVFVRTPQEYRVASNGLLVSETSVDTDKIYHWKHRYAIPAYLIAIAVTDYAVYSNFVPLDNGDAVEVLNYVYPENLENAQNQTQSIVEIMGLFNQLFETYPFASEKYGHAQFGWGGGMEHQTMSFMGGLSYDLQAHELAHQWFGDKITCGSWEDIWLNEGFATYLTGLTKAFLGTEGAWQNWKQDRITSITSEPGGSVWVNDTTSVGRIFDGRLTYNKGAMVLHMLRWKLGDENFFQGIQNYLADPALAFGYAKTENLQQHLEAQSGQNLQEFFADWFYGQGYPTYETTWWKTASGIGVLLHQTTSHNSVDFFEMPVPIYVEGEGQDSLLRLEHIFPSQTFEIELPFEVNSIAFDPTLWLVSKENSIQTGVVDMEALGKAIVVSPNPVNNDLNIRSKSSAMVIEKVEIMNIEGKRMDAVIVENNDCSIDTTTWPTGVYVAHIYSDGYWISKKIIKQ
jgi:aminopeptidase N